MTFDRPNEPPMPEPLAFFLTWTTYGTWLPGDERGWVKRRKGHQSPDSIIQHTARHRMTEPLCLLDHTQRDIVEKTIRDHCEIRGWQLFAVNCRSNHVHVVVAADTEPKLVRDQFKAWCTRKLKEAAQTAVNDATIARSASEGATSGILPNMSIRTKWWTEKGSIRFIADEESLEAVILYVNDAQDRKDRDHL